MSLFDVEPENITAFAVSDSYLFKYYVDDEQLFSQHQEFSNIDKFELKAPDEELSTVKQLLDEYYYDFNSIDRGVQRNCGVREMITDSLTGIRNAVVQTSHQNNGVFLIKDWLSFEQISEEEPASLKKDSGGNRWTG